MARQRKAAASPAGNLKALISAAAVAATLGGWAALAPRPTAEPQVAPAAELAQPAAPLPTLVPLEGASPQAGSPLPAEPSPALREVSAPPAPARPAPITTTRSSR